MGKGYHFKSLYNIVSIYIVIRSCYHIAGKYTSLFQINWLNWLICACHAKNGHSNSCWMTKTWLWIQADPQRVPCKYNILYYYVSPWGSHIYLGDYCYHQLWLCKVMQLVIMEMQLVGNATSHCVMCSRCVMFNALLTIHQHTW